MPNPIKKALWKPFRKRFNDISSRLDGVEKRLVEIERHQEAIAGSLRSIEHLMVLNDTSNEQVLNYLAQLHHDASDNSAD